MTYPSSLVGYGWFGLRDNNASKREPNRPAEDGALEKKKGWLSQAFERELGTEQTLCRPISRRQTAQASRHISPQECEKTLGCEQIDMRSFSI
jgi:hypothetical protein